MTRAVVSLAIVLAAYSAYAFLVVPQIEPEVARRQYQERKVELNDNAPHHHHSTHLAHLFPPDAWELQETTKSLESARATVKFKDYGMVDDGKRMELTPCTVILHSDRSPKGDPRGKGRHIVLSAPEGALLEFDSPVELSTANADHLVGGQLRGPLVIFSPESHPGAGDELHIETKNIFVTKDRIWTPHEVRMRYGANLGSGRDLNIRLLPNKRSSKAGHPLAKLGALRSLELTHVDRFHLELPGGNRLAAHQDTIAEEDLSTSEKFEISCRGPFRYDFEQQVASFIDQVDVVHLKPNGIGDQLNCRKLEVLFSGGLAGGDGTTVPRIGGEQQLEPKLLRALGHPVIVRSPSNDFEVRTQRLEYDLLRQLIRLSGSESVTLRLNSQLVTTPKLEYELSASGNVGRLWAAGPGKMETKNHANSTDQFTATWQDELRLRPQNEHHVLSLMGGARLKMAGTGEITAREIHCWLVPRDPLEKSRAAGAATLPSTTGAQANRGAPQLVPRRLKAVHNVLIHSPQVVGKSQELKVWLKDETVSLNKAAPRRHSKPRQSDRESHGVSNTSLPSTGNQNRPQDQLQLRGNLIELEVVRAGDGPVVSNVTVEGKAFVSNSATDGSGDRHLTISGETLDIRHPETQRADIHVQGMPAEVRSGTLALSSNHIQFDQQNNHIRMNGPGWMTVPIERDLEGRPLSQPQDLFVSWKGRMEFDGARIHFEDSIEVRAKHSTHTPSAVTVNDSQIVSDTLDVLLARPIDFSAEEIDQQFEVRQIEFQGRVLAKNRSHKNGDMASLDTMVVSTLSIDQRTGKLLATGPGKVTSVRYARRDFPSTARQSDQARRAPAGQPTLNYLNVEFQKSLAGNLREKQLHFIDGVRATYGPVDTWTQRLDADSPQGVGPDGIVMTSHRLSLYNMGRAADERQAIELFATGNTVVEGASFTARAQRVTYASAKDKLVLEGEGRSDAELWIRERVGEEAKHIPAKKINYWPETRRWNLEGLGTPKIGGF